MFLWIRYIVTGDLEKLFYIGMEKRLLGLFVKYRYNDNVK